MALFDTTDLLVTNVADLLRANVSAYLEGEAGPDAVVSVRAFFAPLGQIPSTGLPMIGVFRESTIGRPIGRHRYSETVLRIDFVSAPTQRERSEGAWQGLSRVWNAVRRAMDSGVRLDTSQQVLLGSQDEGKAGVIDLDDRRARAEFVWLAGSAGSDFVFPAFLSRWTVIHEDKLPGVVPVILGDLLGLDGVINLADPDASDVVRFRSDVGTGFLLTEDGEELLTEDGEGIAL